MEHFQFAIKLATKRKELGVTQEQVAQYVGVSKAAVSKWEKGQSYPDITLLPKLATYFNMTIDALLGYEPQMTKAHMRKVYATLAEKFNKHSFAEVQQEMEELLAEYYACFPFLLQMAQLYLNYYKQADDSVAILQRVDELCQRIMEHCSDVKVIYEAEMLLAYVKLEQGQFEQVLEILGEEARMQYGSEHLIAMALSMRGNQEKAKEILQVSMYQHMLGTISSATNLLQYEVENPSHFDETVQRVEAMLQLFTIQRLNMNAGLVFYLQAAAGYIQQQREQQAIEMLEKYCQICLNIKFPIELRGDSYFYLLDNWIANNIHLGAQAPRDEQSIKRDLLASITKQPVFASVVQHVRLQKMLYRVAQYLQIEEEIV
ncbi:helix-turn-helix transcriptional regulator [Metasolibacillus sp. FSL H7-0170]|uniref:helix-turn-helix domain-containing protein n=1 Tax=Metasolibacillus TaxID=2703677 RepID=UPI00079B80E8|nr:helix-turn-helix transcriptional regulator [Metasolibacillus fluoroglycofenilyticus]KYG89050.1 transcriptional regulator [[Bacillus] sp. KCTC 13219]